MGEVLFLLIDSMKFRSFLSSFEKTKNRRTYKKDKGQLSPPLSNTNPGAQSGVTQKQNYFLAKVFLNILGDPRENMLAFISGCSTEAIEVESEIFFTCA